MAKKFKSSGCATMGMNAAIAAAVIIAAVGMAANMMKVNEKKGMMWKPAQKAGEVMTGTNQEKAMNVACVAAIAGVAAYAGCHAGLRVMPKMLRLRKVQ